MNLGVRAHDFGRLPVKELATQIASHGLTCIQLAPAKAIAGFEIDDGAIDLEHAAAVRDMFRRHGIRVSVLGCYINLGDRDDARRRAQLERFKAHLRAARAFGADLVGTETGSLNGDFSRHPDNGGEEAFQRVLAGVRELVDEAERCDATIGIEAVERYVISSPERLRRLIDEVGSPRLQIIYDPVNLLWSTNCERAGEIVDAAHALLGDRIRVVHAKDYLSDGGEFHERPAGEGRLDHARVMRWLKQNHPDVDVLLENTAPATIARTAAFVRAAWRDA